MLTPSEATVLPSFSFVGACNKSSSLVDLKTHSMILDQNRVIAVYASIADSAQAGETETRHMPFVDQLRLT